MDYAVEAADDVAEELEAICGLLESLLAADHGQAGRLRPLVGHISRLKPSRHLQDWMLRMYELSTGAADIAQHVDVSRLIKFPEFGQLTVFCERYPIVR